MVAKYSPAENRLVAALPSAGRRDFLAGCEQVELRFADVLCEAGAPIRHVYLPLEGFISLVTELEDGERLEIGIVGNEGMLGTSLVLGLNTSPHHALVQGAGVALRMSTAAFKRHCQSSAPLRRQLHRYIYVLMGQLAQTAACTRYHLIDARLARWLLMTRDRARRNEFHLTHKFLAYMLGVRRVGVTQAATSLQELGLISYSRGEIRIVDGPGMEKAACSCYRRGNEMYEHAMRPRG